MERGQQNRGCLEPEFFLKTVNFTIQVNSMKMLCTQDCTNNILVVNIIISQNQFELQVNFQLTKKDKSKIVIVPFQVAERSGVQFKLSHFGDQWIFSGPRALSVHFVDCRQKPLFLARITQFNIPFSLFLRKSSDVFEDFFVGDVLLLVEIEV